MEKQEWNTGRLWHLLMTLLCGLCLLIFILILYLPLKPTIEAHLNAPQRTEAEIRRYEKQRLSQRAENTERVEDGIHLSTGLAYAEGFETVRASCLSCHSSKLITQNRADRAGWHQMIRWMQKTQGLQDLGEKEGTILDYLSKHYAATDKGRRPQLNVNDIVWYELE